MQVQIDYIDDVNLRVRCDEGVALELKDYFRFRVPGYQFTPKYKAKIWDGYINLFTPWKSILYVGLLDILLKFCRMNDYEIILDPRLNPLSDNKKDYSSFVNNLKVYSKGTLIKPWDHQREAILAGLTLKRMTLLSPTSSGKSLMIYAWSQYYLNNSNNKILIIVPSVSLVHQLSADFDDYHDSDFSDNNIHKIFSGQDKDSGDKRICITTWQSVFRLGVKWFEQFKVCINDECHQAKSGSIQSIMEKLVDCPFKIGVTGTLDGSKISSLVIQGLFGPIQNFITTKELMDKGDIAKLKIHNIIFKYPEEECKIVKKLNYQDEIKYIVNHDKRNNMISDLALTQKKSGLILVNNVAHVKDIAKKIKAKNPNKKVYVITGSVDSKIREAMRIAMESESDAIITATYGTMSTGISIKNLHWIVFGSPTKSQIRTLQSIGRGLRTSSTKFIIKLFDIIDDFSHKKHKNFALKHFVERMKMYSKEKFDYTINKLAL